jgi:hypothetical protein
MMLALSDPSINTFRKECGTHRAVEDDDVLELLLRPTGDFEPDDPVESGSNASDSE